MQRRTKTLLLDPLKEHARETYDQELWRLLEPLLPRALIAPPKEVP